MLTRSIARPSGVLDPRKRSHWNVAVACQKSIPRATCPEKERPFSGREIAATPNVPGIGGRFLAAVWWPPFFSGRPAPDRFLSRPARSEVSAFFRSSAKLKRDTVVALSHRTLYRPRHFRAHCTSLRLQADTLPLNSSVTPAESASAIHFFHTAVVFGVSPLSSFTSLTHCWSRRSRHHFCAAQRLRFHVA